MVKAIENSSPKDNTAGLLFYRDRGVFSPNKGLTNSTLCSGVMLKSIFRVTENMIKI